MSTLISYIVASEIATGITNRNSQQIPPINPQGLRVSRYLTYSEARLHAASNYCCDLYRAVGVYLLDIETTSYAGLSLSITPLPPSPRHPAASTKCSRFLLHSILFNRVYLCGNLRVWFLVTSFYHDSVLPDSVR